MFGVRFEECPIARGSRNRKKLLGCAHAVEMWSRLWREAEKMAERNLAEF